MKMENYQGYFTLLEKTGKKKESFNIGVHVGGYNDVMHYMADMIKVCLMALEGQDTVCSRFIPEPNVNIAGVLELLLNMIPYEESELLDKLYNDVLNPHDDELELLEMNLWLTPPKSH